jgi:cell wall-associated NlpC family hydrolase
MPDASSQFSGWDEGQMTREQVAQAAYEAGWRGDDLAKIVAISYRESGGHFAVYVDRPSTGDWSYGLVGLNVGRPDPSGQGAMWKSFYSKLPFLKSPDDLRDPVKNLMAAKSLFDQSGWRPWGPYKGVSETTGTDLNAARSAVASAASHGLLGKDYDTGLHPLQPDAATEHPALEVFLHAAEAQVGDAYRAGATPSPNDPDPHAFDCSSLVQWAAHQAGVQLNRTAEAQYLQLKGMGATISVQQALHTPGALLFHLPHEPKPGEAFGPNAHVAISLGDGRTVEAIGTKWGVREVDVATFHHGGDAFFTRAAVIPGLSDATTTTTPPVPGAGPSAPPADELPRLAGSWRTPADAPAIHAAPSHLLDVVALPPLPGVIDHSHELGLAPLAPDPHQQPVLSPPPPPVHAVPSAMDALHPASPIDPVHVDAHPAITPQEWARGTALPGELHHYDWDTGHPVAGETHHPEPHDTHAPVHDTHHH